MEVLEKCPVCASQRFSRLWTRTVKTCLYRHSNDIVDLDVTALLCRSYGIGLFNTRATDDEMTAKYSYLAQTVIDGIYHTGSRQRARRDYLRSQACLKYCASHGFEPVGKRVLDLGGASGRVLQSFVEWGAQGYVVDMTRVATIPGVMSLGGDIGDVRQDLRFDLVVCAHVLEHLIDPRRYLQWISERLSPGGMVYCEVPLGVLTEIRRWRQVNPLGHINFFSTASLQYLLSASGLKPQGSEVRSLRYGDGHLVCIRSISTPAAAVPDAAAYRRTRQQMWNPAAFLHYSKALCQRVGQRVLRVD